MNINRTKKKIAVVLSLIISLAFISSRMRADTGTCGGQMITLPFTDVPSSNIFFCAIAEAYFSALTNGTSATTYSPSTNVPREQMAAFITRTMDQSLKRSSKRAALNQYWTTQGSDDLALTAVSVGSNLVQSDGVDLWVANSTSATVNRVRASDGRLIETWTNAPLAIGVLCARGKVFVSGQTNPGSLYEIDPTQPAAAVTTVSSGLGASPQGIAYDGHRIWTTNVGTPASVSIINLNPVTVTNVTTGFTNPRGIIYDGVNIWVTDDVSGPLDKLHKLDQNGAILLSVDVGTTPLFPAFDGTNIWVPNLASNTVSVVRATGGFSGTLIATLNGNGLSLPRAAGFDGERILVTNFNDSVSLWKATDLTPIGTFSAGAGTHPLGVCSDGLNFWIALPGTSRLARF